MKKSVFTLFIVLTSLASKAQEEPKKPEIGHTPGGLFKYYYQFNKIDKDITVLGHKTLFPKDISNPEASFTLYGDDNPDFIKRKMTEDMYKRYCLQQVLTIDVSGHEDRKPGGMIEIEWPSFLMKD
jgi:hypothetical protein